MSWRSDPNVASCQEAEVRGRDHIVRAHEELHVHRMGVLRLQCEAQPPRMGGVDGFEYERISGWEYKGLDRSALHCIHVGLPSIGGLSRRQEVGAAIECNASRLCAHRTTNGYSIDNSGRNLAVSPVAGMGRA